jgi:hypothetical protein
MVIIEARRSEGRYRLAASNPDIVVTLGAVSRPTVGGMISPARTCRWSSG